MAWRSPKSQSFPISLCHALCLFILIQSSHSAPVSSYLVSSFSSPNPSLPFRLMAVDNTNGDVYIGAEEEIYHLGTDFVLREAVEVGLCNIQESQYLGEQDKNRLLVIAPAPTERLITCGRCDGYCETRKLSNITDAETHYGGNDQVVVRRDDVPMVGVVALSATQRSQYLFTGISLTHGYGIPISKFDIISFAPRQRIAYQIGHETVNYIQVMLETSYIYYTIQLKEPTTSPVIGRLCVDTTDPSLESYTQIQIECKDDTGLNFTVIQAANIEPAGAQLADSLSISSTNDVMYAVFTKENSSPVQSALCLYKMSDIQEKFTQAVVGCITCQSDCDERSIDYLQGSLCGAESIQCPAILLLNPSTTEPWAHTICTYPLFGSRAFAVAAPQLPTSPNPESRQCQATEGDEKYYAYANGVNPVTASPILTFSDVEPTSIITTTERDYTVAFIGSSEGDLLKVHILDSSSAYHYENVPLGQGPVLRDVFLDEDKEQIILATGSEEGSQVLKLSLANCSNYQTCDECIGGNDGDDGDPYCGWCALEAR
ncbi:plexin-B2-like [Diadema antillarum]|uniref:plexin-B2-like n=1 Tax=Diadema antillarum TaxID=105358 RepID=UPI003A8B71DB